VKVKTLVLALLILLGGWRAAAQSFQVTAKSSGSPTALVTNAIATKVVVSQAATTGLTSYYIVDNTIGGTRTLVGTGQSYTFINAGGFPTGTSLGTIQPVETGTYTFVVVQSGAPVTPNAKTCPTGQVVNAINEDGSVSCVVVASSAPVDSVFGRQGAVTAQTGDYSPSQVGLADVTNDAQTKAAIVPNTLAAAAAVLVGNAGGTAYASVSLTGDCTLSSLGVVTCAGFVPTTRTVNGHALSSNVTVTASDVGLGSVTNDAQTKAAVVPNTLPAAAQLLIGNAGGTAYAPVSLTGDCSTTSLGAFTCTKTNGTSFAAIATSGSASDLGSGTVSTARLPVLPFANGGTNTIYGCPKRVGNSFYLCGYGGLQNGNFVYDAVTTTGAVVTSATAHFQTTAVVGEDAYVLNGTAPITGGTGNVAQILSIDSDSQITLNQNNSAAGSGRTLYYGSNDDAAWSAMDTDMFAAGVCNVSAIVGGGLTRVTQGHLWNLSANCQGLDTTTGGVALIGRGVKSSDIVIGPDYDYTHPWGNSVFYPSDIQFTGLGLITSNGNNKTLVLSGAAGDQSRFSVSQINKTSSGFLPVNFQADGGGCVNCFFDTTTAIAITNNVTLSKVYSGNGVSVNSGYLKSVQSLWGQQVGPGINCNGAVKIWSLQDRFDNVSGTTTAIKIGNAGCLVYVDQGNSAALSTASSAFFSAGGAILFRDSQLGGGSGGAVSSSGATGTPSFTDLGGNTFTSSATNPFINYTVGTWSGPGAGNNIYAACTGTATSSATLGLYDPESAPNVTATTCTSTTLGSGKVMNRAGHLAGIIITAGTGGVNASSGVFTVLKNGSTTAITCTMGTATTCRDFSHAPVATVQGDLISIQFTTQGSETLANVKATVIEIN
jgi:hypothetical protein